MTPIKHKIIGLNTNTTNIDSLSKALSSIFFNADINQQIPATTFSLINIFLQNIIDFTSLKQTNLLSTQEFLADIMSSQLSIQQKLQLINTLQMPFFTPFTWPGLNGNISWSLEGNPFSLETEMVGVNINDGQGNNLSVKLTCAQPTNRILVLSYLKKILKLLATGSIANTSENVSALLVNRLKSASEPIIGTRVEATITIEYWKGSTQHFITVEAKTGKIISSNSVKHQVN